MDIDRELEGGVSGESDKSDIQRFSIALSVSYSIIPDDSANRKYRWKVFFYWVF